MTPKREANMLWFLLGLIIGCILGVFALAIFASNRGERGEG